MKPNTHYRFFEVTVTIAIPDYHEDSGFLDVRAFVEVHAEAEMLYYTDRELTLNYKEETK